MGVHFRDCSVPVSVPCTFPVPGWEAFRSCSGAWTPARAEQLGGATVLPEGRRAAVLPRGRRLTCRSRRPAAPRAPASSQSHLKCCCQPDILIPFAQKNKTKRNFPKCAASFRFSKQLEAGLAEVSPVRALGGWSAVRRGATCALPPPGLVPPLAQTASDRTWVIRTFRRPGRHGSKYLRVLVLPL